MRSNVITLCFILVVMIIAINACKHEPELQQQPAAADNLQINLKWNKAYPAQTPYMVETGLQWCFSFLGATLPVEAYPEGMHWKSSTMISINLNALGFNETALRAFSALIPVLKASEEYRHTGGIDIGRFVMLTINSSNHYYKITGARERLQDFESDYTYESVKAGFAESSVSRGHREISIPSGNNILKWGFIGASGKGSLLDGTFHATEHEVLDIMPNGQFRVAIYNQEQELSPVADSMYTFAGKPAKCLWCHETKLQKTYEGVTNVPGYYPIDTFQQIVKRRQAMLETYRTGLSAKLDFTRLQEHALLELLYISFMEPSAERLANEWDISVQEVRQKLSGLNTHLHDEFLYLGDLYYRKDVEQFSPYTGIRVPDHAREQSAYEPDLIH
jgi:hypothetical protein